MLLSLQGHKGSHLQLVAAVSALVLTSPIQHTLVVKKMLRQKIATYNSGGSLLHRLNLAPQIRDRGDGSKLSRVLGQGRKMYCRVSFPVGQCAAETSADKERDSTVVEKYFNAWNRREMEKAISYFTDDCIYDDTQYSESFHGKKALRKHLFRVANALPRTFEFVVDDLAVGEDKIGVQWHVENNGEPLPFTRGCSFYTVDKESGLIKTGFDVPEPAVLKPGDTGLAVLSLASKIIEEPIRLAPLTLWFAYLYVVFFSNGILPGADVLQLEPRTWEEVRDLSINFFFVAPLLKLPFSPVVHPMLESIFNLLLAWAAMFAGFLSDEREEKPNALPFVPIVIGMQFLTSAFFLPYLATRTSETLDGEKRVKLEDIGTVGRIVGESRVLGPLLGGVGTIALVWAFLGRPEFGDFHERYSTFVELLSIDRVGSSFVVDLVVFGLFQGWLVDDDMRRRGVYVEKGEMSLLRAVAKYLPFFGITCYLVLRPDLPSKEVG